MGLVVSRRLLQGMACAQAVLLLLQGLDLDAALAAAAAGEDQSAHRLGASDARAAIDGELLDWGRGAPAGSHAPVLLAWSAFAALAGAGGGECPDPFA